MGNVMDTKHNAQPFDSFTAAANGVRLSSGAARVALTLCHLEEAQKDVFEALQCAWRSGDFDRYDQIGQAQLEIHAATERLRKLSV